MFDTEHIIAKVVARDCVVAVVTEDVMFHITEIEGPLV